MDTRVTNPRSNQDYTSTCHSENRQTDIPEADTWNQSIPSALSHHPTTKSSSSSSSSTKNERIPQNNCRLNRETEDRRFTWKEEPPSKLLCFLTLKVQKFESFFGLSVSELCLRGFWIVVAMCTSVGISASQLSRLRIRSCSFAGFSSTGGFLSRTRSS